MEPLGGRISGRRLATLLGEWRQRGSRQGASDLAAAVELHVLDGQLPIGTRLPAEPRWPPTPASRRAIS
ncbi:PLP-dependent aminotransferase family protein, partial [Amycolatopsis sp. NPDC000740]